VKKIKGKKYWFSEISFFVLLAVGIFLVSVFLLLFLKKISLKNKVICNYLGGIWEKKATDVVHRCYTYEEFYAETQY